MSSITINGNTVDPAKPQPGQLPSDASKSKFIILQCHHRLSAQENAEIKKLGVQILSVEAETSRHTSYLCRYEKDDLKVLQSLAFIQHALVYVSDFVTESSLRAGNVSTNKAAASQEQQDSKLAVAISLHETTKETGLDLLQEIKKAGGDGELINADESQLRVRLKPASLTHIAKLDYVKSIEPVHKVGLHTAVVKKSLGVGRILSGGKTFRGKGEVIAVADQGLDTGNKDDIHPAFREGGATGGKPRVLDILNCTENNAYRLSDPGGHGTHVAGCAVGSMVEDHGVDAEAFYIDRIDAPASEARLVFQVVSGGQNTPALRTMFSQASGAPYQAKIHSNSWGDSTFKPTSIQPPYNQDAGLIDSAMVTDKQLLILFAAGNDGGRLGKQSIGGNQYTDVKFIRQIGGEAAAKNALTVGATINERRVTRNTPGDSYCVDGEPAKRNNVPVRPGGELWYDSSKGPTCELRLKPDVVAPGVGILSARTRQPIVGMEPKVNETKEETKSRLETLDDSHSHEGKLLNRQGEQLTRNFSFMSGTSQATPIVAGCAAALRQALKSKENPIVNPSGVLVKALLVNGAQDLEGKRFKVPNTNGPQALDCVMSASPNTAQGFGEVNLDCSLRMVFPEFLGELQHGTGAKSKVPAGGMFECNPLNQGDQSTVDIELPETNTKLNLRVTMAYNDKAGPTIQDKLDLTVTCLPRGTNQWDAPQGPDPIHHLPWQRAPGEVVFPYQNKEPQIAAEQNGLVFTHNNVQRVTCSVQGKSKVRITVKMDAITPPDGRSLGHACCWLFY